MVTGAQVNRYGPAVLDIDRELEVDILDDAPCGAEQIPAGEVRASLKYGRNVVRYLRCYCGHARRRSRE